MKKNVVQTSGSQALIQASLAFKYRTLLSSFSRKKSSLFLSFINFKVFAIIVRRR